MKFRIFYHGLQRKGKPLALKRSTQKKLESILHSILAKSNPILKAAEEVSVSLTLCGKSKIRKLNLEYRKKDKVTDVLSFGLYENLRFEKKLRPKSVNLQSIELGDVFICREVALLQSKEFQISYEGELVHLFVHGLLHLLGYDHEISQKELKLMESWETQILDKIYE